MSAPTASVAELEVVILQAKAAAIAYYQLTGRPLGITGEVGEYEAARALRLTLAPPRSPGFDATDPKTGRRFQIKARASGVAGPTGSQRVGRIKLEGEWEAVLLVVMDRLFSPIAIYEAERGEVEAALCAPGSKARNERGTLTVSKFKSIGRKRWVAAA